MILEGLVTTLNEHGQLNVAPMGPIVTPEMTSLILRPFQTSQTYQNLIRSPYGVFHITDDILLLTRTALNMLAETPETHTAEKIPGRVLTNCCRWYEFQMTACDATDMRTRMTTQIVSMGRQRDFLGWNRAQHAVLEATILATRLHLLPPAEVQHDLSRLEPAVRKTGGPQEFAAWELVKTYIDHWSPDQSA